MNPQKRLTWLVDLSLLALLIGLFYAGSLGSHPLTVPDEARYSEVAREMVESGDFITPKYNGLIFFDKPPLFYWLQASAIKAFGVTEHALRFWPMVFGVFGCLIIYTVGRLLYSRRTGLIAAAALATTPLYFFASHYANLDLEVAVWVSGALFAFITAMAYQGWPRRSLLWIAYLFSALAVLTKGLIGIAFPIIIIGAWIVLGKNWRVLKNMCLVSGLCLFTLIAAPWFWLVQTQNPEFLYYFIYIQHISRFVGHQFNNSAPTWFYLPIIVAGILPWTVFLPETLRQNVVAMWQQGKPYGKELYLLLWPLLIFLFFSIPNSKLIGYILPVIPPLILLISAACDQWWQTQGNPTLQKCFIIGGLFFGLLTSLLLALPHTQVIFFHIMLSNYHYAIILDYVLAGLFCLGMLLLFCLHRRRFDYNFLIMLTIIGAALCLVLKNLSIVTTETSLPLIAKIRPLLQPDDEIVAYHRFYYDLPIYTGHRITAVNYRWDDPAIRNKDSWKAAFLFALDHQSAAQDWVITDPVFWDRWNSGKRMWVFLKLDATAIFQKRAGKRFVLVGGDGKVVLVTNGAMPLETTSGSHLAR